MSKLAALCSDACKEAVGYNCVIHTREFRHSRCDTSLQKDQCYVLENTLISTYVLKYLEQIK